MPKKIDPVQQKKDFEDWKESNQFKHFEFIVQSSYQGKLQKDLGRISQTSKDSDLSGRFQALWDSYYRMAVILKCKIPLKQIKHQWMRSLFFGYLQQQKPQWFYDGQLVQIKKEYHDAQHNLRQVIIKRIYNIYDDPDPAKLNETTYIKVRSELKKAHVDMFKQLKNYLKKIFKIIYEEILLKVVKPLSNLLEINVRLYMFQIKYKTQEQRNIYSFKEKAFVQKYCIYIQEVIRILNTYQQKPLSMTPDMRNTFKKLKYPDWRQKPIENWYLTPLQQSLNKLKTDLMCLFSTGVNFWIVPIEYNKQIVEDLKRLIIWQVISERLLGNELVRDQINFLYNCLKTIFDANQLAAKYLKNKDTNTIQISIPRLIVVRTIQYMRDILDRKAKDQEKEMSKKKQGMQQQVENMEKEKTDLSKSRVDSPFKKSSRSFTQLEQVDIKDESQEQIKNYGRYWLWPNFCDQENQEIFEESVEMIKEINKAVQQDIVDAIIRDGMLPKAKRRDDQQLIVAAQQLKRMKTQHNSQIVVNISRPPQLWNFPKVIQQEHRFRSIADPKKCYIDGRIADLEQNVIILADHIKSYNKIQWDQLITRVIDCFSQKYDQVVHDIQPKQSVLATQ